MKHSLASIIYIDSSGNNCRAIIYFNINFPFLRVELLYSVHVKHYPCIWLYVLISKLSQLHPILALTGCTFNIGCESIDRTRAIAFHCEVSWELNIHRIPSLNGLSTSKLKSKPSKWQYSQTVLWAHTHNTHCIDIHC
jgi:hypothetical protein